MNKIFVVSNCAHSFNSPKVLLEPDTTNVDARTVILSILLKSYWNAVAWLIVVGAFIAFNSPKVLLELWESYIRWFLGFFSFNSPKVLLEHKNLMPNPKKALSLSILLKSYWNVIELKFCLKIHFTLSILLKSYWNGLGGLPDFTVSNSFNSPKVLLEQGRQQDKFKKCVFQFS